MRLSLHIGTEKSGTTTIQRFLFRNRDLLREHGVCIPSSLDPTDHRKISAMFLPDDIVDDFFRHQGLQDEGKRRAAKLQWREKFSEEMRQVKAEGVDRVIISSEHLQSRLTQPNNIGLLRDFLGAFFSEIEVILYIRDPLETAVSLYSTGVKSGGVQRDVPLPSAPYWENAVNHRATIERWQGNFNPDSLCVRIFQKEDFVGGNLLDDFIAASGIPGANYVRPGRVNESLDRLGIEILRRINMEVPAFLDNGQVNPERGNIVNFFEKYFCRGEPFLPNRETICAYDQSFRESNDWVRRNFFPSREFLFSPKDRKNSQGASFKDGDLDQISQMFSALWSRGKGR